jgi:hypothetical protein
MKQLLFCTFSLLVILSSCRKYDQKPFAAKVQKEDKALIWAEANRVAKEVNAMIDTLTVMRNIDSGKLTISKLNEIQSDFENYDPINNNFTDEYYSEVSQEDQIGGTVYLYLDILFPQLKSRGYPSSFSIGFNYDTSTGNGSAYGSSFYYQGYDPYHVYYYTQIFANVVNFNVYCTGKLNESYLGIYKNYLTTFESKPLGGGVYASTMKIQLSN